VPPRRDFYLPGTGSADHCSPFKIKENKRRIKKRILFSEIKKEMVKKDLEAGKYALQLIVAQIHESTQPSHRRYASTTHTPPMKGLIMHARTTIPISRILKY
jgi:hypothetical protein